MERPLFQADVLSLFPEMLRGFFDSSILGKACQKDIIRLQAHQLRDWATGKHAITDDRPFGGGAGMVLKPEPVFAAFESLTTPQTTRIYLSPDGVPFSQELAIELATRPHLLLLSGHYEGIDERIRENIIDMEISIGDYVLSNGTLAAAVILDAICRNVPGVLGEEKSLTQDCFNDNLLSFPQFTRPYDFRGMKVPDILMSGDHGAIARWREEERRKRTQIKRPDLISSENESDY